MNPSALPNLEPGIRLCGSIEDATLASFLDQLDRALARPGVIVLELMTIGGDADVGRRIALEMRLVRERQERETRFIGKTAVYSAGVSIMSAFRPADRYLSRDTLILIHERRLDRDVHFVGPLQACIQRAKELISELENGLTLQKQGFTDLIAGTQVSMEQICERAKYNWYLSANEALELALIGGIL
jgi:ATP-dependent protease ClpP protease subunit